MYEKRRAHGGAHVAGRALVTAAVVILGFSAAVTVAAKGPATLQVPSQATPGSTVTVSGSGFQEDQVGMLTYNGGKVISFVASSGSFTELFKIPDSADVGSRGRISAKTDDADLLATSTLAIVANVDSTATDTPGPTDSSTATDAPQPSGTSAPATPSPATPSPATPTPPSSAAGVPNFSHIYVIMMENREYSSIVGSSSAPYINSLIAQYGLATSSYAIGHPSEPNYVAFVSGGTQGVTSDGHYDLGADNLFAQVSASGRTWRAYEQSDPGNCFAGSSASSVADGTGLAGSYARKHNPAILFTSVSGNAAQCSNIVGLAGFDPAAANFEFITPNEINDMHDGSTTDGDAFLRAFVPQITTSPSFANSLLVITWDEGSSNANGGGHIVTIAITPHMTPGFEATATYNHYSVLRTIEQAWGLPYLGAAASASALDFPY